LIAVGGTLATALAGLAVIALTQLIGVKNLLWIVALAMLICIACVAMLARWQRAALPAAQPAPAPLAHSPSGPQTIMHSPG
jgi:hypothetical protein